MQITIDNEDTRRVIFYVLWWHAHSQASDAGDSAFSDRLFEHARTSIDARLGVPPVDRDPSEHLFELMDLLAATRVASEQLSGTELGQSMEVPLDQAALVACVKQCLGGIESDEGFWEATKSAQERIISCRAAAVQLLEAYGEPAGAVA